MVRELNTIDIRGEMILLGVGTSVGVPVIGCSCAVCTSGDPKNDRTRSSAILGLPDGNLLIDTSPDLRQQLLRENIGIAHAVLYTHEHADHLFGLDDVRLFPFHLGHPVPLYCEPTVESRIRKSYDYAFSDALQTHQGAIPKLEIRTIGLEPFELLGAQVTPIRLLHGANFQVLGFRFGNVAYCTDVSEIPESSMTLLHNLDVLVLSALRHEPHATHMSLDEAVAVAQRLQPKRTVFTHMSCHLDYRQTNATLPHNVQLGYDGLRIPLT